MPDGDGDCLGTTVNVKLLQDMLDVVAAEYDCGASAAVLPGSDRQSSHHQINDNRADHFRIR
jgi:hypothetical protein